VDAVSTETVVLDNVGPASLLNADVGRTKINVRPRNKRAPTTSHLRLRQHATELDDETFYHSTETASTRHYTETQLTDVVS